MTHNFKSHTNQDVEQIFDVENLDVAESRKVLIPTPAGSFMEAQRYQAVWNLSKNVLGCIASKEYNIIQHKAVVQSLFDAIKGLNLRYDFNMRTQGHRVFLDISFPDTKLLVEAKGLEKGEEFIGGIRLINSYDKTTGLLILPRLCRVACANGMIVSSFIKGYSIRHNQELVKNFEVIIETAIGDMINSCDKLKAVVNDCIEDSIEWSVVELILEKLISYEKHRIGILQILKSNEKLKSQPKLTRWDIYNAVTQYATHGAQLKPSIESWLQGRAQKLLETKLDVLANEKEIMPMVRKR